MIKFQQESMDHSKQHSVLKNYTLCIERIRSKVCEAVNQFYFIFLSELSRHVPHKLPHKLSGNYDPLKIPCDWKVATNHGLSRRVARDKEPIEFQVFETCKCCGYQIEKDELSMDCDPIELKFLGSGFPLFYNFIKFCIFILFQFLLFKGIFCLSTDLMGDYCFKSLPIPLQIEHKQHQIFNNISTKDRIFTHMQEEDTRIGVVDTKVGVVPAEETKIQNQEQEQEEEKEKEEEEEKNKKLRCPQSFWYYISLANVYNRADIREMQTNLSLVVVFTNMITLLLFRKAQRQIDIEIDESQLTPSDYTICVKNIPKQEKFTYKEELKKIFTHYAVQGRELEVTKIVLVYNIDELIEVEEELKEVIKEKQNLLRINKLDFQEHNVKEVDEKIEHLEHKIHTIEHNLSKDPKMFSGIAFVSFLTEDMKNEVLAYNTFTGWERFKAYTSGGKHSNPYGNELMMGDNKLYCEPAPEPNDVDWEFVHITTGEKIKCRLKAWTISICFMFSCFFMIWGLTNMSEGMSDKVEEQQKAGIVDKFAEFSAAILSSSISWTIIFFNKFVIGKVYHLIVDMEKISNKTKFNISFAQKQSVALFINTALISLVIEFFITGNIVGKGGFIFNETNVFLLNAFIPPIVWFVDPWSLQMDYKRNKELRNARDSVLTQQQANEIMEMPDYSQAKRYGDIMKTMWFTFFYGDIIPVGVLFSIMGLSMYYFVDKFNVIRRRTIKENLSKQISFEMIEMVELIICFQGIGNLVVSFVLFNEINWQDIFIICCAMLYGMLPMEEISQMLFPISTKSEAATYWDAQEEFDTDYDKENPVTKKEAMKAFQK